MPQVDLETIVSPCEGGGNDNDNGKIVCEAPAEGGASSDDEPTENDVISDDYAADAYPNFLPESFWLSKDSEYDWFDRNAVYERKESTKGNSNSTNPSSNSNSQRFSINLKSKTAMLGLPKTHKTTFVDSKRRTCKPANIRLFPKRTGPVGKSTVQVTEPGSPKVSCMGRVRSKRGRRRSNSSKRREKPPEKTRSGREKQKTGFYSKVMSMFRSKKSHRKPSRSGSRKVEGEPVVVEPKRKSRSLKVREIPVGGETVSEPLGLGGVKRFASGRRSDSWTA